MNVFFTKRILSSKHIITVTYSRRILGDIVSTHDFEIQIYAATQNILTFLGRWTFICESIDTYLLCCIYSSFTLKRRSTTCTNSKQNIRWYGASTCKYLSFQIIPTCYYSVAYSVTFIWITTRTRHSFKAGHLMHK